VFEAKDGIGIREFNTVVEARAQEIVENVNAQVKFSKVDSLGAGVFLAGRASALNNLQELVQEKLRQEVRFSTIRYELMENEDERTGNPLYMTAISLLLKGTENCLSYVPPLMLDSPSNENNPENDEKNKTDKKRGGSNLFGKLFKLIEDQD
jgi:cell division ATPase FtsA